MNEDSNDQLTEVAEILAEGILRRKLRDVRKPCKYKRITENSLEVSSGKSLHRLEPKHGEENR